MSSKKPSVLDSVKEAFGKCAEATGLCCFKAKEQAVITKIELQISNRKSKFGKDYITMIENKASPEELEECLKTALAEIQDMQRDIDEHLAKIDDKVDQVNNKKEETPAATPAPAPAPAPATE